MTTLVGALALAGCTIVVDSQAPRPVHRMVLMGDSVAFGMMPYLAEHFEGTATEVHYRGLPGHGLLSAQGLIGPGPLFEEQLKVAMVELQPEVVVIQSAGMYPGLFFTNPYVTTDGVEVEAFTELFWSEWEAVARRMTALARAHGATIWWTTTPVEPGMWWEDLMHRLNDIHRSLDTPVVDFEHFVEHHPGGWSIVDGVHFSAAAEAEATTYLLDHIVRFERFGPAADASNIAFTT